MGFWGTKGSFVPVRPRPANWEFKIPLHADVWKGRASQLQLGSTTTPPFRYFFLCSGKFRHFFFFFFFPRHIPHALSMMSNSPYSPRPGCSLSRLDKHHKLDVAMQRVGNPQDAWHGGESPGGFRLAVFERACVKALCPGRGPSPYDQRHGGAEVTRAHAWNLPTLCSLSVVLGVRPRRGLLDSQYLPLCSPFD